jgi:DNA-binding NtrC family response regulator
MEFEFIGPDDKPAMVLLSTPEWAEAAKASLAELGYKVHTPETHEEFTARFSQLPYQVLITEVLFAAAAPAENLSLIALQKMPMSLRRHAVVVVIGNDFQTLNAMQAFQQSVHAVIHPHELSGFTQILRQVIGENELLYSLYRATQLRIAQGKL